jgi:hypothetical protein
MNFTYTFQTPLCLVFKIKKLRISLRLSSQKEHVLYLPCFLASKHCLGETLWGELTCGYYMYGKLILRIVHYNLLNCF